MSFGNLLIFSPKLEGWEGVENEQRWDHPNILGSRRGEGILQVVRILDPPGSTFKFCLQTFKNLTEHVTCLLANCSLLSLCLRVVCL